LKKASEFSASIAAGVDGGILEVRLDKLDGNKIARLKFREPAVGKNLKP
jgi:hypothetical protein